MNSMNRRTFIKKASAIGITTFIVPNLLAKSSLFGNTPDFPDIAIIEGTNLFQSTLIALERLGGMQQFVKPGQKVGLLINSDFELPGVYTHPDVSLAVLKMCFDQGASEVTCLQYVKPEYWERSAHKEEMNEYLAKMGNEICNQFPAKIENGGFVKKTLPDAIQLKEAEMVEKLFDIDVLINLPIAKHHASTLFTGALKNMMGVNTRATNVFFHLKGPVKNDPLFLAQCIADINKFRPADLTVMDASTFLITNGPGGPGDTKTENKIIAGKNMVAIDAIGCSYHGWKPDEVPTLVEAEKAGLGTKEYSQLKIYTEKQ